MSTTFSVERFLKTAARLSSDNEHERSIAAKQASALLAQAGLTWEEVLRRGLPAHLTTVAPKAAGGGSAFDSIFGEFFRDISQPRSERPAAAPAPASPTPAWRRRGHTIVQGADIPRFIQGRPEVREPRTEFQPGKFKMILGVVNDDKNERYDPMVLFNTDSMDLIELAVKAGTLIGGRVTPATQIGHLPVFMLTVS